MFRIDNATAAAALAAATADGVNPDGYFTDGDAGLGTPATVVNAEWLNMVQEEIAGVITAAGDTLDKADRTQLRQAITTMLQNDSHSVILSDETFEASVADAEVVYWDSANTRFDEALADGSATNKAAGIADVTNARVIAFGETPAGLMSGLTPGARYYLDETTPGAITTVAPADAVLIGIAKSATVLFVDIDRSQAGGIVVDVVHEPVTALVTGTALFPIDDTIPQQAEGNEFITATITPKSAGNKLLIEASVMVAHTAAGYNMTTALFQDATADALAAIDDAQDANVFPQSVLLRHEMVAGTTAATTFKIRCGANVAGTTSLNGVAGRYYGGVAASSLRITETSS